MTLSERIKQKAAIFEQYAQSGELTTLPGAIQLKTNDPDPPSHRILQRRPSIRH